MNRIWKFWSLRNSDVTFVMEADDRSRARVWGASKRGGPGGDRGGRGGGRGGGFGGIGGGSGAGRGGRGLVGGDHGGTGGGRVVLGAA